MTQRQAIEINGLTKAFGDQPVLRGVDDVLTGRENLVLVAQQRRLPEAGVAADLLARFDLTEAGGRRAATYSGGMRRRLDIAMSLIGIPPGAVPQ